MPENQINEEFARVQKSSLANYENNNIANELSTNLSD